MTRPAVSVVMPFAGGEAEATAALRALTALDTAPGDELILADNTAAGVVAGDRRVRVVRADGERSPAHARNAGARDARADWILFLDADIAAPRDLLDRFFTEPVGDAVGALAGAIAPASGGASLAARYGAARSFLDHDAHLAHPYMPRAAAANLLVRRSAFEEVGGFHEGLRAAEDTDFSWRLQRAGWRLEGRRGAVVEHRYRTSVAALRRQWRGYAAGRAWLARRYHDFEPEPALARALRRRWRPGPRSAPAALPAGRGGQPPRAAERAAFTVLDALLGFEELAGFALSNRPAPPPGAPARVVLVADRFPAPGDPRVDLALSLAGARVEAAARPEAVDRRAAGALRVDYREDDGLAARWRAAAALARRHPLRCVWDVVRRERGEPGLVALAPAVLRLERDPDARLHPLSPGSARAVAARLARLAGRRLES